MRQNGCVVGTPFLNVFSDFFALPGQTDEKHDTSRGPQSRAPHESGCGPPLTRGARKKIFTFSPTPCAKENCVGAITSSPPGAEVPVGVVPGVPGVPGGVVVGGYFRVLAAVRWCRATQGASRGVRGGR